MTHSVDRIPLKSPSPGTERFLTVHRFGTEGARPKAYLHAALHADEWPGLMALHHLIPMLDAADRDGKIVGEIIVLPYANPIGMDQRQGGAVPGRYAYDGSGNFNRNWPDLSHMAAPYLGNGLSGDADADIVAFRGALKAAIDDMPSRSDVEHWRATLLGLSVDSDYVIDIHCDQEAQAHVYCHVDHAEIAREMAAAIDFPVVLLEEEAGGFSFDDCNAGVWRRMGGLVENGDTLSMTCFACTLELRGKDDIEDDLGRSDAEGLYRFLAKRGLISGVDAALPDGPIPYRLDEVDVISSPIAGLVAFKAAVGETVAAGQVIADVIDLAAADPLTARIPLKSSTDGLFFARNDLRLVQPGENVGKVAGRKPLAHRKKGALLEP